MSKSTGERWTPEQRDALEAAMQRGFAALRCEEPLTLWEWADEHFYMSAESSSIEGQWKTLPYQRYIMGAISNDDIEVIDWQKCKRVGYTKILTAAIGYFSAYQRRSGVVYQPTETDAEDYVTEHVDPMLRDVEPVRKALRVDPERKSRHNKKDQKAFVGALLHIRGGKSERAYRMLTKDVVIYDELSAFDGDIDGAGSPISLGDGRLETSCYPKSIRGSTPKIRGTCQIEASIADAEIVFWPFVRCRSCGELHRLTWEHMIFDPEDVGAGVHHACPHCGYAATYGELAEMDEHGACCSLADDADDPGPGPYSIDVNGVVARDGERFDVRHIGFRIWSAYSYYKSWASTAREFVEAKRKAERGDRAPLKTWTNTVAGETWEEEAIVADGEALFLRREHYTPDHLPSAIQVLTSSIDVQDTWMEACVYGWGVGEESWHVEKLVLECDPSQPEPWEDAVEEFLLRERRTLDGRSLRVRATGVDTGHHTDAAYRFCRTRRGRGVFALKGRSKERDRPIIGAGNRIKGKGIVLHTIGSHNAKALILQRLRVSDPGPGYCHISLDFDAEHCEQLTAEKLVKRMRYGREVSEFVEVRRRNEGLDLFQYGLAALYWLYLHGMKSLDVLAEQTAAAAEPTPAPSPVPFPSRAQPVRGALRRRRSVNPTTNW